MFQIFVRNRLFTCIKEFHLCNKEYQTTHECSRHCNSSNHMWVLPKNWQDLDSIILYKHVHINIYICTIKNISTSPTNRGYEIIFYCYCIALIVQSIPTITFVALEEKYIYGTVRLSLFFPYFHVEKMH